jgi:WD40 repeat protein
VLYDNCFSCHGGDKKKGGLSLNSREAMLEGSDNGEVVQPGRPQTSLLIEVLAPGAEPHMPPKQQLDRKAIRVVERWVKAGAPWDDSVLAAAAAPRPVSLEPLPANYQPAKALALSPDDRRLAFTRGSKVLLIDTTSTNQAVVREFFVGLAAVESLAWNADGTALAVGGFRSVTILNPEDGSVRGEVTTPLGGRVTAMAFPPGENQLLVADSETARAGWVRLLAAKEDGWSVRASWEAHADAVNDLILSDDGRALATAGGDKLIKVWSWPEARETARLEGHTAAVLGLAFNTNATQVASVGADKELKVWDVASREKIISLGRFTAPVGAVVWRSATNALFAADDAGGVVLYQNLKAHSGEQSSSGGDERKLAKVSEPVLRLAAARAALANCNKSGLRKRKWTPGSPLLPARR